MMSCIICRRTSAPLSLSTAEVLCSGGTDRHSSQGLRPVVNGGRIGGGGASMVSEHNNQSVGANNLPSGMALGQGGGG